MTDTSRRAFEEDAGFKPIRLESQDPPTAPVDDTAPSIVPKTVTRDQVTAALEPLAELLGIPRTADGGHASRVYPDVVIGAYQIKVVLAGHVITGAAARSVTVEDGPFGEFATEVRVRIV